MDREYIPNKKCDDCICLTCDRLYECKNCNGCVEFNKLRDINECDSYK